MIVMKEEYDFSKGIRNPYVKELKKQITIKIDVRNIDYFKKESLNTGIPYQTLINMYLSDCVKNKRKLNMSWE